jgi:hypothetical protein
MNRFLLLSLTALTACSVSRQHDYCSLTTGLGLEVNILRNPKKPLDSKARIEIFNSTSEIVNVNSPQASCALITRLYDADGREIERFLRVKRKCQRIAISIRPSQMLIVDSVDLFQRGMYDLQKITPGCYVVIFYQSFFYVSEYDDECFFKIASKKIIL